MTTKGKGLISLSQIEGGDTLQLSLNELIEYLKQIDPSQYRKITDLIGEKDLTPEIVAMLKNAKPYDDTAIKNLIANLDSFKADKSTLENDYRKKAVFISINDLDEDLKKKINTIVAGGYDDTEIKKQISDIITTKLSKVEAESLYRDKNTAINKKDLDADLTSIIDSWENQDEEIRELKDKKADKTDLTAYRPKNVAISKADLATDITQILDKIPPAYDDTHILLVLEELRTNKADVSSLALYVKKEDADKLYRLSSKAIELTDLSEEIQLKLKNIPNNFDPVNELQVLNEAITSLNNCKADKSSLEEYRKKIELIHESDLDTEVAAKLNAISKGYDDSVLRKAIQDLQTEKLGIEAATKIYRKLDTAISEKDLTAELQLKINNVAYDDSELRSKLTEIQGNVDKKANLSELDKYRKIETKISESDLDDATKAKLNAISKGYDDTEVKNRLKNVEDTKADKVELNKYRLDDKPISESELSQELKDKVNNISGGGYDDTAIKDRVSKLENDLPSKLSKDEATNTYRNKTTKIVYEDLGTDITELLPKIDKTAVVNSLELSKLLGVTKNPIKVLKGKPILFKRGLFEGQVQGDLNSKSTPLSFNYGNLCFSDNPVIVRMSARQNGYTLNMIINQDILTSGSHELKLYSNGVTLYGLSNLIESKVDINVVDLSKSVSISEIYLNDGKTTSKLDHNNLSIADLSKKPTDSKIEIPVTLPTDLEFLVDGGMATLTLSNKDTGSIKDNNTLKFTLEGNKMIMNISDFIKLKPSTKYTIYSPIYDVKNKETIVMSTAQSALDISFVSDEPPLPEGTNYIDFIFTLPAGGVDIDLVELENWDKSWVLTNDDIYGTNDECSDYRAELQHLGVGSSTNKEGKRVPRIGVDMDDELEENKSNGRYQFNGESGVAYFIFDRANVTSQRYRLLKKKK